MDEDSSEGESETRRPSEAEAERAAGSSGGEPEAAGGFGGEVLEAQKVVAAAGAWLNRYRWTHIAVLTFDFGYSKQAAMRYFRAWIRRIQFGSTPIPFAAFVEGDNFGHTQAHVHAIVAVPLPTSCKLLENAWPHGWARVRVYDRSLGGAYYVAKEMAAFDAEWDVSYSMPEEF